MKKYFLFILVLTNITNANASDWRIGSSKRCMVDRRGSGETFYYCGSQDKGCAGYMVNTKDREIMLKYGDRVGDSNNYCCENNKIKNVPSPDFFYQGLTYTDENGTKYEYSSSADDTTKAKARLIRKNLDKDGKVTCTYQKTFDACGKDISVPCEHADDCKDGQIWRNGECTDPCSDTQAFESEKSNKCVECVSDLTRGIFKTEVDELMQDGKTIDRKTWYICKQCEKLSEFYSVKKQACVKKDDLQKISQNKMKQCWACKNDDLFKKCIQTDEANYDNDIKTGCYLN